MTLCRNEERVGQEWRDRDLPTRPFLRSSAPRGPRCGTMWPWWSAPPGICGPVTGWRPVPPTTTAWSCVPCASRWRRCAAWASARWPACRSPGRGSRVTPCPGW